MTPAETAQLTHWWRLDRCHGEDLASFLTRHGVFAPYAAQVVEFMRRGVLPFADANHLFAPDGVQKCRQRFQLDDREALTGRSQHQRPHLASSPGRVLESLTLTERRPVVPVTLGLSSASGSAPPSRRGSVSPGRMLGKCLLLDEIGRGGCGVVFRGFHQALQVPVAVKVLLGDGTRFSEPALVQLRHEARLLARLKHPHIVGILDFEDDVEFPYLVLEYVDGVSLDELIQQSGRLRWDRAAWIGLQIGQALQAAHRLGIIHRDIKPGNILIHREGQAKLADLGLAVVRQECGSSESGQESPGIAGTVAYMAPEQARGSGPVDERSDIYALGATLYHAVTGRVPFLGRTRAEVLRKHASEPLIPPEDLVPDLHPGFARLLGRMLAKHPQDRPASYDELIGDLRRMLDPAPALPPTAATDSEGIRAGQGRPGPARLARLLGWLRTWLWRF